MTGKEGKKKRNCDLPQLLLRTLKTNKQTKSLNFSLCDWSFFRRNSSLQLSLTSLSWYWLSGFPVEATFVLYTKYNLSSVLFSILSRAVGQYLNHLTFSLGFLGVCITWQKTSRWLNIK